MAAPFLPPSPPPLRLVLDTNTVMALWVFEDPKLAALRTWVESGALVLLADASTLEELRRVLAYRQFAVPVERQVEILAAYTARTTLSLPRDAIDAAPLPACRDADDQKFLELARNGGATHLVSRDKLLLKLARHGLVRPLFAILSPEALQDILLARV